MQITTTSLSPGREAKPYTATFASTGGQGNVTWSVVDGSLPDGLALSSNGVLSGTPTTAVVRAFVVEATDQSNPPQTARMPLSITIATFWDYLMTAMPNVSWKAAYLFSSILLVFIIGLVTFKAAPFATD